MQEAAELAQEPQSSTVASGVEARPQLSLVHGEVQVQLGDTIPHLLIAGLFALVNLFGFLTISQLSEVPPQNFFILATIGAVVVTAIALVVAQHPVRALHNQVASDPWKVAAIGSSVLAVAAFIVSVFANPWSVLMTDAFVVVGVIGSILVGWWVECSVQERTEQPFQRNALLATLVHRLKNDGSFEQIRADQLRSGDRLRCVASDTIPIDGEIEGGSALVSERRFSGRESSRVRVRGQRVFAGSRVVSGEIVVVVTNPVDDTAFTYFLSLRDRALPPAGADLRRSFTVIASLFVVAVGAILFWRDRGMGWSSSLQIGSAILALSLVGALWKSYRWSAFTQIERAFQQGIIVRSLDALARLVRARAWIFWFQEEGASVRPQFQVVRFELLDGRCEEAGVREAIAAVATGSECPWSDALGSLLPIELRQPHVREVGEATWYSKYPGFIGSVDGVEVSIGPESFLIERGISIQGSDLTPTDTGESLLLAAFGPEVVARIIVREVTDPLLPRALNQLRTLNRTVALIGPGKRDHLDRIGRDLGFDAAEIRSEVHVTELQSQIYRPAEAVVLSLTGMRRELAEDERLVIAPFNPLLWELEGADLTILEGGANAAAEVLRDARRNLVLNRMSEIFVYSLTGVLFLLALVALISPLVVALSVLTATVAIAVAVELQRAANLRAEAP